MFLDRLQSGFLLLETPHGMVPVELTCQQRIYLLWAFRHFRQLSLPLLNRRQVELIHALARNAARTGLQSYDPELAVGVVENFMFARADINGQEKTSAPAPGKKVETAPKVTASIQKQHRKERAEEKAKLVQLTKADRDFALKAAKLGTAKRLTPKSKTSKAPKTGIRLFGLSASRFAAAAAVLCLCAGFVVILQRMQVVPGFEAYSGPSFKQMRTAVLTGFSKLAGSTTVAAGADTVGQPAIAATPESVAQRIAGSPSEIDASKAAVLATNASPAADAAADSSAAPASPVTAEAAMATPATASPANVTPASTNVKQAPADKPSASVETSADVRPARTEAVSATAVSTSAGKPDIPASKALTHAQGTLPAARTSLSSQNHSSIQATRPPLHFVYPIVADNSVKGVVALTAQVDSTGSVRAVKVVSGSRELADAAVRAVRQWRYRPYIKDGQTIATETNIVISFFSNDAISMSYPPSIASTR